LADHDDWNAQVDDRDGPESIVAEQEEQSSRSALLADALKTLSERDRHILIERRLKDEPTTLEVLARHYGISRERVHQLEVRAFGKLQKAMQARVAERRAGGGPIALRAAAA